MKKGASVSRSDFVSQPPALHHKPTAPAAVTPWLPLVLCVGAMITGCSAARWDGRVSTWGGMREVMRAGQSEGRVSISEALGQARAFGVGAVEGLRGEIVIDDGRCWIGEVATDAEVPELRVYEGAPTTRATLLAVAYVPKWSETAFGQAVGADEVEARVRAVAERAGIDTTRPFPFVIEGELCDLAAHVINRFCPMNQASAAAAADHRPIRLDRKTIRGKLIGIYAENSAGELTHHGTSLHVHVLTDSPRSVAHVERFALGPHARLRLPAR